MFDLCKNLFNFVVISIGKYLYRQLKFRSIIYGKRNIDQIIERPDNKLHTRTS